jgi:hypothetical protein
MNALADLANRQDGRPPIRIDDWRMFLICLSSSRTLREAMGRAADFYRMLDDRWGHLELRTRGEIVELRADSLRQKRNAIAFAADTMGLAALHGLFSWMIRSAYSTTRTTKCRKVVSKSATTPSSSDSNSASINPCRTGSAR